MAPCGVFESLFRHHSFKPCQSSQHAKISLNLRVCSVEMELFWPQVYPWVSRARISSWLEALLKRNLSAALPRSWRSWGVSQVPVSCSETAAWLRGHWAEGMALLAPGWPLLQELVEGGWCGAGLLGKENKLLFIRPVAVGDYLSHERGWCMSIHCQWGRKERPRRTQAATKKTHLQCETKL